MCKMADYAELYAKAELMLRIKRISKATPGYELLRRAIVIWQVEGKRIEKEVSANLPKDERSKLLEEKLVKRVKEIAPMELSKNSLIKNERDAFSQAMIESIRAVSILGDKTSILDFVVDVTEHI